MSARFVWIKSGDFAGRLEGATKKLTMDLAKKIFDGVVARTPVLSGSARASWVVSAGSPVFIFRDHRDVNNPLPPPAFTLMSIPPYQRVYIANGAPYILDLEYGSSSKAPQGMLRVTLVSLGL